ncbi:MBL fold metallo-hydrolase [bacterium]|nr:MBL fold metallo-hydrolase [bacterium]
MKKRLICRTMAVLSWLGALFMIWHFVSRALECQAYVEHMPFQAHFLNVDFGDCILLRCGGSNILVDGGSYKNKYFAKKKISQYLCERGIKKLDAMVCTHGHSDHYNGLEGILEDGFPVNKVYVSHSSFYNNRHESHYDKFLNIAKEKSEVVPLKAEDEFELGKAQIKVLSPIVSQKACQLNAYRRNAWRRDDKMLRDIENNHSLVLRAQYKRCSLLLLGDALLEAEMNMLNKKMNVASDVVKVGHHGLGQWARFYEKVSPKFAVFSCSGDQSDNPASLELAKELRQQKTEIMYTYRQGDIVMGSNGRSWTVARTDDSK